MLGSVAVAWAVLQTGQCLLSPLLPAITADLGLSEPTAGLALGALEVAYTFTQYPSGRYSDSLGRATLVVPGLVVLVVCFLVLAVANSSAVLVAGVVLLGIVVVASGYRAQSPIIDAVLVAAGILANGRLRYLPVGHGRRGRVHIRRGGERKAESSFLGVAQPGALRRVVVRVDLGATYRRNSAGVGSFSCANHAPSSILNHAKPAHG